jgi:c(7)-type cytochrome triheme protein
MRRIIVLFYAAFLVGCFAYPLMLSASDAVPNGGDIIYDKPVKAVQFSHKFHAEDLGMDCGSCHDGIFKMEAMAAQKEADFTMEGLSKGKYCGACHEGSMAFDSDSQCARCHIGVKGYERAQAMKSGG